MDTISQVISTDVLKGFIELPKDFTAAKCKIDITPVEEHAMGRRSVLARELSEALPDIHGLNGEEIISSEIVKKYG